MIISEYPDNLYIYKLAFSEEEVDILVGQDLVLSNPCLLSKGFTKWIQTICDGPWTWTRNTNIVTDQCQLFLYFRAKKPVMIIRLKYGNLLTTL